MRSNLGRVISCVNKEAIVSENKKKARSLSDLAIAAKIAGQTLPPHKAYQMISGLEMEKHRLEKEKINALKRVDFIEKRLDEIELERVRILQGIVPDSQADAKGASASPQPILSQAKQRQTSKFTIKY